MKVISYMVPIAMLLLSFLYNNTPFLIKDEAHQAFELINDIRRNPEKYYTELQLDNKLPISTNPLRWNDTLAGVAEAKAMDMAKRNYVGHVTPEGYGINYLINQSGYSLNGEWLKANNLNCFETVGSGEGSGIETVKSLITDEKDNNKSHRNHLLGITQWDASLHDIGIGFVKSGGSTCQSYICIIIAKHKE